MSNRDEHYKIRTRLRTELAEYLARPHRLKKHCINTRELIYKFFRETKNGTDGWALLDSLDKAKGDFANGSELKAALRDQLIKIQTNRCCYCRRWLVNTAYARPIEHILPRSQFRQYSLHFWNLAIACTDCNSVKSDNIFGTVKLKRRSYPCVTEIDDWYHPRFHSYDEHVRFIRIESNGQTVTVFLGITKQGKTLCNHLLKYIAAKEMLIANNTVLSSCITTLNEFGDRLNGKQAQKLQDFQNELSRCMSRTIGL